MQTRQSGFNLQGKYTSVKLANTSKHHDYRTHRIKQLQAKGDMRIGVTSKWVINAH